MTQSRKYLRNRNTGVVFPFSEKLAKNKNMEPCNENGRSVFDAVETEDLVEPNFDDLDDDTGAEASDPEPEAGLTDPAAEAVTDNGGIIISRATKPQLIDYAKRYHGVDLDESMTVPQLRDEVRALEA